jgi:hypothetical protein
VKQALVSFLLLVAVVAGIPGVANESTIKQDELVRRSQELFDSVAPGNTEPFQKYFAEDAIALR